MRDRKKQLVQRATGRWRMAAVAAPWLLIALAVCAAVVAMQANAERADTSDALLKPSLDDTPAAKSRPFHRHDDGRAANANTDKADDNDDGTFTLDWEAESKQHRDSRSTFAFGAHGRLRGRGVQDDARAQRMASTDKASSFARSRQPHRDGLQNPTSSDVSVEDDNDDDHDATEDSITKHPGQHKPKVTAQNTGAQSRAKSNASPPQPRLPPKPVNLDGSASFDELVEAAHHHISDAQLSSAKQIAAAAVDVAPEGNSTAQALLTIATNVEELLQFSPVHLRRLLLLELDAALREIGHGHFPWLHELLAGYFAHDAATFEQFAGKGAEHLSHYVSALPATVRDKVSLLHLGDTLSKAGLHVLAVDAYVAAGEADALEDDSNAPSSLPARTLRADECVLLTRLIGAQLAQFPAARNYAECALEELATHRQLHLDAKVKIAQDRAVLMEGSQAGDSNESPRRPRLSKHNGQLRHDYRFEDDVEEREIRQIYIETLVSLGYASKALEQYGLVSDPQLPLSFDVLNTTSRLMWTDVLSVTEKHFNLDRLDPRQYFQQKGDAATRKARAENARRVAAGKPETPLGLSFSVLQVYPHEDYRSTLTNPGLRESPGVFSKVSALRRSESDGSASASTTSAVATQPSPYTLAKPVQAFDNVLPLNLLMHLAYLFRQESSYWTAVNPPTRDNVPSFWYPSPLEQQPRNQVEQAIHYIVHTLVSGANVVDPSSSAAATSKSLAQRIAGVEWWVSRQPQTSSAAFNHSFAPLHWHYDQEWQFSREQTAHPLFTAQLALFGRRDSVSASLIVNQTMAQAFDAQSGSTGPVSGWVVPGLENRLVVIDGALLHGRLPPISRFATTPQGGSCDSNRHVKKQRDHENQMLQLIESMEAAPGFSDLSETERIQLRRELRESFLDSMADEREQAEQAPTHEAAVEPVPFTVLNMAFMGVECIHGAPWSGSCADFDLSALLQGVDLAEQAAQARNAKLQAASSKEWQRRMEQQAGANAPDAATQAESPTPPTLQLSSVVQALAQVDAQRRLLQSDLKLVALASPEDPEDESSFPRLPVSLNRELVLNRTLWPAATVEELIPALVSNVFQADPVSEDNSGPRRYCRYLTILAKDLLLRKQYKRADVLLRHARMLSESSSEQIDWELVALHQLSEALALAQTLAEPEKDLLVVQLLESAVRILPGVFVEAHRLLADYYDWQAEERDARRSEHDQTAPVTDDYYLDEYIQQSLREYTGLSPDMPTVTDRTPDVVLAFRSAYHAKMVHDRNPRDPVALLQYADALLLAGHQQEAVDAYTDLLMAVPYGNVDGRVCSLVCELYVGQLGNKEAAQPFCHCAQQYHHQQQKDSMRKGN
ncbi:hypothetical protein CAOG_00381 [Capsaspora owczarzaki ATCC 30864]|uniref:Uncharacterized protein n=1 Tax=Capsaspora owczarzaki (strain ATCC 30864) TaxID=595528 RepID=A0A0D2WIF3_CAPO3|nr:hypothetical protein CAOG_00381 [Capsaspora owczarzaki ATCC 30864]KJE88798.1 hypothetical protein CAOG_000381 [Capsaspora owczarzaki ATCC 30864]|eukprot:XP_004365252.2 hypothetical protein CAOG_00381 [Capsaspora owczarzaki ATCC 30864]